MCLIHYEKTSLVKITLLRMIHTLTYCFDILSGIPSDIYSDILSDIYSGILSGILSGLYSDILSDILSGILSDTRSDILSVSFSKILSDNVLGLRLAHSIRSWRYGVRAQACPTASGDCNLNEEKREEELYLC